MRKQSQGKWHQRRLWIGLCVVLLGAAQGGGDSLRVEPQEGLEDTTIMLRGLLNDGNSTDAPTSTNTTTIAPTPSNTTTLAPTMAPSNATTLAPTTGPPSTAPPTTAAPTTAEPVVTPSPTKSPTHTAAPTGGAAAKPHKGISFWRFVEKTIAYMILLVLALLGFGAFMANRYRIYFFLRGVWYTILQMECTLWLMRKLRIAEYFGYQPVDTSLNTSIFENEMNEGLLMRETDT